MWRCSESKTASWPQKAGLESDRPVCNQWWTENYCWQTGRVSTFVPGVLLNSGWLEVLTRRLVKHTHTHRSGPRQVTHYIQLCKYGSEDRSSSKYVPSTPSALLLSYYRALMCSVQTGKWGEMLCVVCSPQFSVCACIRVRFGHRNPTPLLMTPGTTTWQTSSLCLTRMCLCGDVRMHGWCCVQNYQLFLKWSWLIASHPELCLCVSVQFPVALLLCILKLTRKPRFSTSSLTYTGVELLFFNQPSIKSWDFIFWVLFQVVM